MVKTGLICGTNGSPHKFSLKKYEKEIKNNLAETITDKLILKLPNIQ